MKMNNVEIATKIVSNIICSSPYQRIGPNQKILIENYANFLSNATNQQERNALIEILKKTDRISDYDYINFIELYIDDLNLDKNLYLCMRSSNQDYNNSTNTIIFSLLNRGVDFNKIFIDNNLIKFDPSFQVEQNMSILYCDNFSGSGTQVIKYLNILRDYLSKQHSKHNELYILIHTVTILSNTKIYEWITENKDMFDNVIFKYEKLTKKYDEIIENKYIDDINLMCNSCDNIKYRFGYKDSKTLISINDLSPNNNISLVWCNNLTHKENEIWYPFLPRSYNKSAFNRSLLNIFKKKSLILNYLEELNKKGIELNVQEFKLIIFCMSYKFVSDGYIMKNLGFNTIGELEICKKGILDKELLNLDISPYKFISIKNFKIFKSIYLNLYKDVNTQLKQKKLKF